MKPSVSHAILAVSLFSASLLSLSTAGAETRLGVRESSKTVCEGRGRCTEKQVVEFLSIKNGHLRGSAYLGQDAENAFKGGESRFQFSNSFSAHVLETSSSTENVYGSNAALNDAVQNGRVLGVVNSTARVHDGRRAYVESKTIEIHILKGTDLLRFMIPEVDGKLALDQIDLRKSTAAPNFELIEPSARILGMFASKTLVSDGRRGGGHEVDTNHLLFIEGQSLGELVLDTDGNSTGLNRYAFDHAKIPTGAEVLGVRLSHDMFGNGRRGGGENLRTANIVMKQGDKITELVIPLSSETGRLKTSDVKSIEHKTSGRGLVCPAVFRG